MFLHYDYRELGIYTRYEYTTVDLEIFVVKIFLWFASTTGKKGHVLQWIIITVSIFRTHGFTAQLASYITLDGLGSTSG